MGGLAWWHWLIIIAAFILLFGARKLPDAARGLGRSLRILKSEVNAMHDDDAGKEKKPSETDVTATASTPTPQITAAPLPVQAPQPAQTGPPVQVPVQQVPVQQAPAQYVPTQPVVAAEPVPVPSTEQYADPTRPAGS